MVLEVLQSYVWHTFHMNQYVVDIGYSNITQPCSEISIY